IPAESEVGSLDKDSSLQPLADDLLEEFFGCQMKQVEAGPQKHDMIGAAGKQKLGTISGGRQHRLEGLRAQELQGMWLKGQNHGRGPKGLRSCACLGEKP